LGIVQAKLMKSVIRLTQILWPLRKFEDPNVYLQVDAFAHIEPKRAGEYVVPMSFHLMTVVGHLTMCVWGTSPGEDV
jgi:hypothetical protein